MAMDKFLMCGVKMDLPKGYPYNQNGKDVSKPVDVGHDGKDPKQPFMGANSEGPWVENGAKKGSGGVDEKKKIWAMADNHTLYHTSTK